MHCYYCGHNKLKSLHKSHRQQTSRWRYHYICKSCNKLFNYKDFINHNKLYKNVLISININSNMEINFITTFEHNPQTLKLNPVYIVNDEGNYSAPVFIGRRASSRTAPYIPYLKTSEFFYHWID